MGWAFLYMMFFLKLPILALLGIVWWAARQEPELDQPSDDGGIKHPPHPRRPLPRRPGPRRGPHGCPAPAAPSRTRSTVVRARAVKR